MLCIRCHETTEVERPLPIHDSLEVAPVALHTQILCAYDSYIGVLFDKKYKHA